MACLVSTVDDVRPIKLVSVSTQMIDRTTEEEYSVELPRRMSTFTFTFTFSLQHGVLWSSRCSWICINLHLLGNVGKFRIAAVFRVAVKLTAGCLCWNTLCSQLYNRLVQLENVCYMHTYKQMYTAPKSWKRIRGAGAGWLDSESRLEEVWLKLTLERWESVYRANMLR